MGYLWCAVASIAVMIIAIMMKLWFLFHSRLFSLFVDWYRSFLKDLYLAQSCGAWTSPFVGSRRRLTPHLFLMPAVSIISGTTGWFWRSNSATTLDVAIWLGRLGAGSDPLMTILGLGFLTPIILSSV
jgi:hypothetical protein